MKAETKKELLVYKLSNGNYCMGELIEQTTNAQLGETYMVQPITNLDTNEPLNHTPPVMGTVSKFATIEEYKKYKMGDMRRLIEKKANIKRQNKYETERELSSIRNSIRETIDVQVCPSCGKDSIVTIGNKDKECHSCSECKFTTTIVTVKNPMIPGFAFGNYDSKKILGWKNYKLSINHQEWGKLVPDKQDKHYR